MKTGIDGVVFGHMHEDHGIELSLLDRLPLRRALVIASGGDLAFALAGEKLEVTAVDSNHAQIDLVRLKMQCPPGLMRLCFCGRVDRVLRFGGPFVARLFGWPELQPGRLRAFLADWFEGFLPQVISRIHGAQAGARLDRQAVRLIRRRLERAMRQPDASRNPLLQALLGNRFGAEAPEVWSGPGIKKWRAEIGRIELQAADFGQVLRDSGDGTLGLVSVSNLPDVMDEDAWDRLVESAARALSSGGYLVVRSMLKESLDSENAGLFAREMNVPEDRSPLCPVIWIGRKP